MFEKMSESSGNVIGFKVVGTITKTDYDTLVPEVEALVGREGEFRLLLDMTEFKWEKVEAWGADWRFGREYRKKIEKAAFVGDKEWEKWLAKLAEPFYAMESKFFQSADIQAAWGWLNE